MMLSEWKRKKSYIIISAIMLILAILFVIFMGSSLVSATHDYWYSPD